MANPYDKAARFSARHLDPLGLLGWLLGAVFPAAWRWTRWLDTQAVPYPDEPDRHAPTPSPSSSGARSTRPLWRS